MSTTPATVTVRAPAKINLYLGVGKVRPDGFHPLETVYQAIGLYDDVTVCDASDWSVDVVGDQHVDLEGVPDGEDNIAIRAGQALARHHRIDKAARIEIHKGIPVAGGMAGGSADAAATLVALDRLWDLDTSDEDLLRLAATLGSDVPFALIGGTAQGTGRGEVVEPVEDNGSYWWVAIFNEEGLSTPSVYAAYDVLESGGHDISIRPEMLEALKLGDAGRLMVFLVNDLEDPAFDLRPDLEQVSEDAFECGALMAILSGSGPTMLAFAQSADHAREIAGKLKEKGYTRLAVTHGPVAGAHVVRY